MTEQDRFDAALRKAARALVAEELPRGVLEPSVGQSLEGAAADGVVRPRRALPGFAFGVAAVAVLVLTIAVAFAPRGPAGPRASATPTLPPTAEPSPSAGPTPGGALRTAAEIRDDLGTIDYTCKAGQPLSSIAPGPDAMVREATVCTAPADAGPFMAAVIVGESAAGSVVEVHAKADIVGADTAAAREAIAKALAKISAISVTPQSAGTALGDWVVLTAPTIKPDGGANTLLTGFDIKVARNANGGYLLVMHLAR